MTPAMQITSSLSNNSCRRDVRRHLQQARRAEAACRNRRVGLDVELIRKPIRATLALGISMSLVWTHAADASQPFLDIASTNDAITSRLSQLRDRQDAFEIQSPSAARIYRLQAAANQIDKVERLVQLDSYYSARLQLREGVASNIRKDLRDAQDVYSQVTSKMTDSVKNELEALDKSLREKDAQQVSVHLANVRTQLSAVVKTLRDASAT